MADKAMNSAQMEECFRENTLKRDQVVIRTSILGIAANLLLTGFKAAIGLLSHSIAITLDAVNNLSDAASSVITIIGAKLAGKRPDRVHPFGHGRMEYLSAMVISALVLYAGITSLVASVKKILSPETPEYTGVMLLIVGTAVAVKLLLGTYVKMTGKKINSDALVNSGQDALLDAVISLSTLAAAAVYMIWGISAEAWLGVVISLIIIKSGMDMLKEAISKIIGESAEPGLYRAMIETIAAFGEVQGVHDLIVHNYGPDAYTASVHIAVRDSMDVNVLDTLTREITRDVYEKHGIYLTAVGVYSVNGADPEWKKMRDGVQELVMSTEHVKGMHGFYIDADRHILRMDVVVSFDAPDREAVFREATQKIQEKYPEYEVIPAMDADFGEMV